LENIGFTEDSIFGQTLEKLFSFLSDEQELDTARRTYMNI